jgi:ABC-type branched-chain amino acid transport systems, periplasmic component
MAVEDYGGKVLGRPIEVIFADHQNKPDIGANIARQWIETEGVTVILDIPNSAVGLAVREVRARTTPLTSTPAPPPRISPEKPVRRTACTGASTPTALRRRSARRW